MWKVRSNTLSYQLSYVNDQVQQVSTTLVYGIALDTIKHTGATVCYDVLQDVVFNLRYSSPSFASSRSLVAVTTYRRMIDKELPGILDQNTTGEYGESYSLDVITNRIEGN